MTSTRSLSHHDAALIIDAIPAKLETQGQGAAIAIAINKAYTAAREQIESGELGEQSRAEGFPMTNFGELRCVTLGGGVPVVVAGHTVGAVGVSGLPEEEDVALARMGAHFITG